MQINRILYHSIQTLIKNVFLLNFAHELLMSFLNTYIYIYIVVNHLFTADVHDYWNIILFKKQMQTL